MCMCVCIRGQLDGGGGSRSRSSRSSILMSEFEVGLEKSDQGYLSVCLSVCY